MNTMYSEDGTQRGSENKCHTNVYSQTGHLVTKHCMRKCSIYTSV